MNVLKYEITSQEAFFNDFSITFWLAGCSKIPKCNGCHSKNIWDFNQGLKKNPKEIIELINSKKDLIDSVVFLSDEYPEEIVEVKNNIDIPVYIYSGREWDDIKEIYKKNIDYIKWGGYQQESVDSKYKLSSINQRVWIKKEDKHKLI